MCGRYRRTTKEEELARQYRIPIPAQLDLSISYNMANQNVPVGHLAKTGRGFRSLREQIDTTTPGGKLVFHLFGALAEFEREVIR
jgi:DNA invertase Pin-like site-specific DNA recombinase